jgi:L-threonylcarbamoyladenylate synthase
MPGKGGCKAFDLESWRSYDEAFAAAREALREGGLCVLPTDTLYGLCANALDAGAVGKVFEAKKRGPHPVSMIVSDFSMMREHARVPDSLAELLQGLFPGPFTVILEARHGLPERVSPDGKVGVRVPHFIFTTRLVSELGFPVTATSANLSGGKAPAALCDVPPEIAGAASVCVDAGRTMWAQGSTIVDLTGDAPRILREGAQCALAKGLIDDFVSRKKA